MMAKTLYDKLWERHVVGPAGDGASLLYIDRHLVHEVTSPQAFAGLSMAGRGVWRTQSMLAMPDHNVPTQGDMAAADPISQQQVAVLTRNCQNFGVTEYGLDDPRQGIVHVVGPEQGATLPGMTIVCGDSHTSTHGAFGALAFGIGTSEVEHVMATQCLVQRKAKTMRVNLSGRLPAGVFAKDMVLALIGMIGTAGATGHVIEFTGEAVRALSMEGRMTLCNMAIEAGARAGLIAVDDTTLAYLSGRPLAPRDKLWEQAVAYWRSLHSDDGAVFDRDINLEVDQLAPQVTWGTSPQMVAGIDGHIPPVDAAQDPEGMRRALDYMGLEPGLALSDIKPDAVFIGSCTNSRLEDLRIAAERVRGQRVAKSVRRALVVPGSGPVKQAAEAEGLDQVFMDAGFEWRNPGCSMCLGMNPDHLMPGERCASTSNRNFEGRQGGGGRTHLVSPAMAAAAAIAGRFVDIRGL